MVHNSVFFRVAKVKKFLLTIKTMKNKSLLRDHPFVEMLRESFNPVCADILILNMFNSNLHSEDEDEASEDEPPLKKTRKNGGK